MPFKESTEHPRHRVAVPSLCSRWLWLALCWPRVGLWLRAWEHAVSAASHAAGQAHTMTEA